MTSLVFFIEQISLGLYMLSMGGLLFMAVRLRRARRELAIAQFKLEREHAQVRQATAVTLGGLLLEFMIGVWAVTNIMAPTIRDIRLGDTIQTNRPSERFVTSTPSSNSAINLGSGEISSDDVILFATPVPTNTPVGTILPEAADIVGCPEDKAWLYIPANGQLLFEATTVEGTANIADFAFYRFEIKRTGLDSEFAPIGGDYTVPVVNGPLGEILPFNFPEGEYRFRLSVFDQTFMLKAVCEVTVHFSAPPPTATPIGTASP